MIKTKVDVVSGFLGAGKTTFIKKLLADVIKDEKVVLIENEFGEIAVDGGFLKDAGVEVKEMNQGCICCSLVGDFAKSLKEILVDYSPDRIIIEPSGVGKLSDVLKAIAGVEDELNVENNSAVTVVDARKCRLYHKNFGEFFNNQIQFASTVILSRTDVANQETVDEAASVIREINPTAVIITTPLKLLSPEKLMEILESPVDLKTEMLAELKEEHHHHHHDEDEECECGHHHHDDDDEDEHEHHHHHHHHPDGECDDPECECHHHHEHGHHHADEVFESWGRENVPPTDREKLEAILHMLADTDEFGQVIRAKGMIPATASKTEWLYFDVVPGEVEIRTGEPDLTGKVCVIGPELEEEKLEEAFR
ncbi:MAG: GTP-binding protein [Lachnospiraceae bacterium]|nr:GTP-binding protein [Lachnospiraceae bacterium]